MTFYPFIKIDLINAKGEWQNKLEVSDRRLVTRRNPNDLDAFNKKIIEGIKEGKNQVYYIFLTLLYFCVEPFKKNDSFAATGYR